MEGGREGGREEGQCESISGEIPNSSSKQDPVTKHYSSNYKPTDEPSQQGRQTLRGKRA